MRGLFYSIAIVGGVHVGFAPNVAHANKVDLEPSTSWNIDYAPNKCRLARVYGEGEKRHLLFFEQYWPSSDIGLTIAGPALSRFKSLKRTYFSTSEAQEPFRTEPFAGDVESVGPAVIYSSIDLTKGDTSAEHDAETKLELLDTKAAQNATFIRVRQGGRTVTFKTGPMGDAFGALNECAKSLLTDWGLDVAKHETARQLPKWQNEAKIVRRIASNYPGNALNQGEQAIVRMRVMIDETGTVTDCVINEATTTQKLESPACGPMAKAKFAPALDADGKPFESYYATGITYRIGG
ncbi:MAG: TonB family protein [Pseudomonadota bacterium]